MSGNRFDEKALTWDDDPTKVERSRAVAEAVAAAVPLDRGMRLLEYGAGTGLVTQGLRDRVGHVTLADSSQGMLDVLRAKVARGDIPDATVWDLDLARDDVPGERFDVAVTVMVLHHVGELGPILSGLARLLVDGGRLCVVDLEEEDGTFHEDADFAGHHGLDRTMLAAELAAAGFGDTSFEHCGEVERHGRSYDLFLATCERLPGGGGR